MAYIHEAHQNILILEPSGDVISHIHECFELLP